MTYKEMLEKQQVIADAVRCKRALLGWSYEKLALNADVSVTTAYNIENNTKIWRMDCVIKVLNVLGLEIGVSEK